MKYTVNKGYVFHDHENHKRAKAFKQGEIVESDNYKPEFFAKQVRKLTLLEGNDSAVSSEGAGVVSDPGSGLIDKSLNNPPENKQVTGPETENKAPEVVADADVTDEEKASSEDVTGDVGGLKDETAPPAQPPAPDATPAEGEVTTSPDAPAQPPAPDAAQG